MRRDSLNCHKRFRRFFMTMAILFLISLVPVSALYASPTAAINRKDAIMVKGQKVDLVIYDRNRIEEEEFPAFSGVKWETSNNKAVSLVRYRDYCTVKAKKAGKATITGTYAGKTYQCKITVYNSLSASKRKKLAKKEAKRIVRKYIKAGMKPQIKALILASYILQNVEPQYDQGSKAYKKNYGNEAYSALIMHMAACSGFSDAYVMLCKAAGLKCRHINKGKWRHQWNEVKLNGKWVEVDTQAAHFCYHFTEKEKETCLLLTADYDHIGPVYRKIIQGYRA